MRRSWTLPPPQARYMSEPGEATRRTVQRILGHTQRVVEALNAPAEASTLRRSKSEASAQRSRALTEPPHKHMSNGRELQSQLWLAEAGKSPKRSVQRILAQTQRVCEVLHGHGAGNEAVRPTATVLGDGGLLNSEAAGVGRTNAVMEKRTMLRQEEIVEEEIAKLQNRISKLEMATMRQPTRDVEGERGDPFSLRMANVTSSGETLQAENMAAQASRDAALQQFLDGGCENLSSDCLAISNQTVVLPPREFESKAFTFMADNSQLRAKTNGLAYRNSKNMEDKQRHGLILPWDHYAVGVDEGDDWMRVLIYLPMRVNGCQVMKKVEATPTLLSDDRWPTGSVIMSHHDHFRIAEQRASVEAMHDQLHQRLVFLEGQIPERHRALDDIHNVLHSRLARLEEDPSEGESAEGSGRFATLLEDYRAKAETLQHRCGFLESRIEVLERDLQTKDSHYIGPTASSEAASTEVHGNMQVHVERWAAAVEGQVQVLEQGLERLHSGSEEEIVTYEATIGTLKLENETLRAELVATKADRDRDDDIRAEEKRELRASFQAHIDTLASENAALKHELAAGTESKVTFDRLAAENETLRAALSSAQLANSQTAQHEEAVRDLYEEVAKHKRAAQEALQQVNDHAEQARHRDLTARGLQEEVVKHMQTIQTLQQQVLDHGEQARHHEQTLQTVQTLQDRVSIAEAAHQQALAQAQEHQDMVQLLNREKNTVEAVRRDSIDKLQECQALLLQSQKDKTKAEVEHEKMTSKALGLEADLSQARAAFEAAQQQLTAQADQQERFRADASAAQARAEHADRIALQSEQELQQLRHFADAYTVLKEECEVLRSKVRPVDGELVERDLVSSRQTGGVPLDEQVSIERQRVALLQERLNASVDLQRQLKLQVRSLQDQLLASHHNEQLVRLQQQNFRRDGSEELSPARMSSFSGASAASPRSPLGKNPKLMVSPPARAPPKNPLLVSPEAENSQLVRSPSSPAGNFPPHFALKSPAALTPTVSHAKLEPNNANFNQAHSGEMRNHWPSAENQMHMPPQVAQDLLAPPISAGRSTSLPTAGGHFAMGQSMSVSGGAAPARPPSRGRAIKAAAPVMVRPPPPAHSGSLTPGMSTMPYFATPRQHMPMTPPIQQGPLHVNSGLMLVPPVAALFHASTAPVVQRSMTPGRILPSTIP